MWKRGTAAGIAETKQLGSGLINLIEMALQTAPNVKEKLEERGGAPVESFDAEIQSRFSVLSGYGRFVRSVRYKLFKTDQVSFKLVPADRTNRLIPLQPDL